ncbi:hypothetical protein WICMUC_005040 [Wickerhamomyces mucosus]|uniref:Uncharacterized protein n=1 Tax=Wickerhamomyces mucosus TaxID=1378264 RepID=A0A9P8T8P3_9ASCO|nr:hypothetical protein WICMUC_005040 [Wickerhamomyces mucosus]
MNIILAKFPEIPPTTFIILNILILVFARRWYFRKGSSEEFLGGISVTKFTNTIDRGLNKSPTTCLLDGEEASLKGNLCLERTEKKIHEPINCYLKRCVSVFQLEEALQSKSANPAIKKFEADVHFVGPKSKKIDDLNLQRNSNSNYKLNDIIKARTDINIHDASKPIPTVLNYPAIDKKGKRMKRIFIPGRGWISVKTLEREKYDLFRTCLL